MPLRLRLALVPLLIGALLASAKTPAFAQAVGFHARLDRLLSTLEINQRMMGSLTIRKADRVVYARTVGMRDSTEAGWIRSDSLTAYRIGSVTKPFTAALVYQLLDEGRLTLDAKVSSFIPELASGDSITIRDLLGHTSGLPDYTRGMDPMVPLDRAALLGHMAQPLQFRPGTQRRYSNSNYLVLGYIVEAITGSTYEAALSRGITDRIGLKRTYAGRSPAANESRAYFWDNGRWIRQPDHVIENAGGAGGISSTTADLTRFVAALFQRGLISQASLTEMTNGFDDGTRKNGKGLGPFTIPSVGKSGFSHDGSIGAHAALIGYVPEDSLALALTMNGQNYPINRVFFLAWDLLYGVDTPLPSFTPVALADSVAAPLVGAYSADAYGLKITVRRAGDALEAQAEGQDAFPLSYVGRSRFLFVPAGIMIDFDPPTDGASPRFMLYQQNAAIPLTRLP